MSADFAAYLPAVLIFVVFLLSAALEPRKLRTGVYLLLSVSAAVLATLELALDWLTLPSDQYNVRAAYFLLAVGLAGLAAVVVLGVFLVLNGLTMLRKEGRRLSNTLALLLGLAILSYVAILAFAFATASEELIVFSLFVSLPLMYLSFIFTAFVGYSVVYGATTRFVKRPADAVIVLGAGLIRGRVTPLLAARLDGGLSIYDHSRARGRETIIIASGGQGADEPVSEAEAMANYLVDAGTDLTHVFREEASTNTKQNLEYSRAVLERQGKSGRVAVVTNNFHAFRAALLMRAAGLDGYAYGARTAKYYWPSATIREFIAVLRDHAWLHGSVVLLLTMPLLLLILN